MGVVQDCILQHRARIHQIIHTGDPMCAGCTLVLVPPPSCMLYVLMQGCMLVICAKLTAGWMKLVICAKLTAGWTKLVICAKLTAGWTKLVMR